MVPRLIVTNFEHVLSADDQTRALAAYLRSCGARPIDAIGKICVPSPISVQPSMTTEAPIRQFRPMRTSGPMTARGPIEVPVPICAAASSTCAVIDEGWSGLDSKEQLCFGDHLIVDIGGRLRLARRERTGPNVTSSRSGDLGTTRTAESALLTPLRRLRVRSATLALGDQRASRLRKRLNHEDGWKRSAYSESVPWLFLADRNVLRPRAGYLARAR